MARNPAFTIIWDDDEPGSEAAEEETPPPPAAPVVDRAPKSPKATLAWDDDEVVDAADEPGDDEVDTEGVVVLPSLSPEYWRAVLRIRTEFNRPVTRSKAPNTTAKLTDEWMERSSTAERLQSLQEWRDVMGWGHVG